MTSADRLIGIVSKNAREEVRISLSRFKGVELVDVRIYANFNGVSEEERRATKKGVSLKLDRLPALIEGLKAAYDRTRDQGLVDSDQELAA
jgi:hypothetical protein